MLNYIKKKINFFFYFLKFIYLFYQNQNSINKKKNQLIKAPFAKTYNIIKTASHAASADLDLLSGEVRIEIKKKQNY